MTKQLSFYSNFLCILFVKSLYYSTRRIRSPMFNFLKFSQILWKLDFNFKMWIVIVFLQPLTTTTRGFMCDGVEQLWINNNKMVMVSCILRCTRPPHSQSGAVFCHLNHHCVVFKTPRQLWIKTTERYKKYASDYAFWTSLANKFKYL